MGEKDILVVLRDCQTFILAKVLDSETVDVRSNFGQLLSGSIQGIDDLLDLRVIHAMVMEEYMCCSVDWSHCMHQLACESSQVVVSLLGIIRNTGRVEVRGCVGNIGALGENAERDVSWIVCLGQVEEEVLVLVGRDVFLQQGGRVEEEHWSRGLNVRVGMLGKCMLSDEVSFKNGRVFMRHV